MFRRREDGAEIVSWMAQSSRRHIAVEQIDVADQPRIEQRGLVGRRLSATDQRARAAGTIFRELFAQRREWSTGQRGDRATEAVEDVALEELADVRLQSPHRCAICKGGDRVDCRNRNTGVHVHADDPPPAWSGSGPSLLLNMLWSLALVLMKVNTSALNLSASVWARPCEAPGKTFSCAPLTIFAVFPAEVLIGTIWSSSP